MGAGVSFFGAYDQVYFPAARGLSARYSLC